MISLLFLFAVAIYGQCPVGLASSGQSNNAPISKLPYFVDFEDRSAVTTQNWHTQALNETKACSSWLLFGSAGEFKRVTPASCRSGSACFATGSVKYNSNEDSVIYSPQFDFSALENAPVLSFWVWYDTVIVRDGLFVEYSTDGQMWKVLGAKGDASWYNSNALLGDGKSLVGAFSGKITGWRLVSHKLDAAVGQAQFWLRFHFVSGSAPATGGVLLDDVVISKSTLPDCPIVTEPVPAASKDPLPFPIKWNPVVGADYYDIRYSLATKFANTTAVGAGVETSWLTPANADGLYNYQVSSRTVDGTTNPFCAVRTFVVGAQGVIKSYPYTAKFESGSSDGWQGVDWDNGRFVFGTVATNPSSGVAYVSNPKANDFVVLQSPPFDLSKLRSSILSINVLWSFMSGGASIQFSNDRGRSWHQVGAPGAGTNWFNTPHIDALATFLKVPTIETPPGWSGSRATFTTASFSINSATMPRDVWVPCAPEVYFRVLLAVGSVGGGAGFFFDDFSLRPDPLDVDNTCGSVPTFAPPAPLTPAPTPVYVPPPPTTTTQTTESTTTSAPVASTTSPITSATAITSSTKSTTSGATMSGSTVSTAASTAPSGVSSTSTMPPTSLSTSAKVSVTPSATIANTFAPTPVRTEPPPPSSTETSTIVSSTTTGNSTIPLNSSGKPLPPWAIAIIVIGFILCCLLLLLLLFLLRRKQQKDDEAARKDAEDDDEELGRMDE